LGYGPVRDIGIVDPNPAVSRFTRLADARLRGRVFRYEDGGD
jgi:hypothetical protein